MNEIFNSIKNRRSIGKLDAPAPAMDEINALIELAMTAPDHKELKPWRFVLLQSQTAKDDFGQALLRAGQRTGIENNEPLDNAGEQKLLNSPNRAPMILVCISDYKQHKKVPKFEQILAMGACIQNLLIGLESLGYQSIWRSGLLMNEKEVKALFNVSDDNDIAGFIYMGSSDVKMPERVPLQIENFVEYR